MPSATSLTAKCLTTVKPGYFRVQVFVMAALLEYRTVTLKMHAHNAAFTASIVFKLQDPLTETQPFTVHKLAIGRALAGCPAYVWMCYSGWLTSAPSKDRLHNPRHYVCVSENECQSSYVQGLHRSHLLSAGQHFFIFSTRVSCKECLV